MTDADKLAQMLYETIHVLESMSLTELLPIEAWAWYGQRKLEDEKREASNQTKAEKFLSSYLQK